MILFFFSFTRQRDRRVSVDEIEIENDSKIFNSLKFDSELNQIQFFYNEKLIDTCSDFVSNFHNAKSMNRLYVIFSFKICVKIRH